ncbi:MAG: DUF4890 domain-containing protein [Prevotellaceae bacterium]|jgi:hypothetical protein|nr:DUF4890 domain-containing protein [Prevotellaceae bacterium]
MKKFVTMMMALLLMGGMAMAQPGGGFMDPKQMTDRMVEQYSLNDTQKAKVLEATTAFVKEMQTIFPQDGGFPQFTEELRTKMQKIQEGYSKKLQGILTAEQFKAYTKDQEELRARMQQMN